VLEIRVIAMGSFRMTNGFSVVAMDESRSVAMLLIWIVFIHEPFSYPLSGMIEGSIVNGLSLQFKYPVPHGHIHVLVEVVRFFVQ